MCFNTKNTAHNDLLSFIPVILSELIDEVILIK